MKRQNDCAKKNNLSGDDEEVKRWREVQNEGRRVPVAARRVSVMAGRRRPSSLHMSGPRYLPGNRKAELEHYYLSRPTI